MSNHLKQGADYFPVDVFFEDKIESLQDIFGSVTATGLWLLILQHIYRSSYWCYWQEKHIHRFATHRAIDFEQVKQFTIEALNNNVFNKCLYEKYQILTSCGIQKRYAEIVKRRAQVEIILEYKLIDGDWGKKQIVKPMELICDQNASNLLTDNQHQNKNLENSNKNNVIKPANKLQANCKQIVPEKETKLKETKLKEKKKRNSVSYTSSFESWWKTYPKRNGKRLGKKDAFEVFKTIPESDLPLLGQATKICAESPEYPKDAVRFLKKDLWKDYLGDSINLKPQSGVFKILKTAIETSSTENEMFDKLKQTDMEIFKAVDAVSPFLFQNKEQDFNTIYRKYTGEL